MLEDSKGQRAFLVALAQVVEIRRALVEQSLPFALMDERSPCDAQMLRARFPIMRDDADVPHRLR